MVIIESPIFTRLITSMMNDDEYRALQESLINRPDSGDLIKQSGGLRKVRWNLEGQGKSGGIKAIYYWVVSDDQIYMVYAYAKGKQGNLTSQQLVMLKTIVKRWSDE